MATGRPTLHHLDHSQSMRTLWLLEELGIDYDLKLYERGKAGSSNESRAPAELKTVSPLGKAPVLVTAEGRTITESNAIATYLIKTYDTKRQFQGDPATGNDEIRDNILTDLASASLSVVQIIEMMFAILAKRSPFVLRWFFNAVRTQIQNAFTTKDFKTYFSYLEDQIGEQDYFMGASPGRADFALSWPFDFCTQNKFINIKDYPKLDRWYTRCQGRDGWKRSRAKGNGYKLSF